MSDLNNKDELLDELDDLALDDAEELTVEDIIKDDDTQDISSFMEELDIVEEIEQEDDFVEDLSGFASGFPKDWDLLPVEPKATNKAKKATTKK